MFILYHVPYVNGFYIIQGTLHQYTKKHGGMELSHVQKCTRQLLEGVAHLHKSNCVHRDIKGPNILRDSEGNIKLADFGCTKTLEVYISIGNSFFRNATIHAFYVCMVNFYNNSLWNFCCTVECMMLFIVLEVLVHVCHNDI